MKVIVKWHNDMWQEIKDDALFTIHKNNGKYPTEKWKKSILAAEHSPIRTGRLIIECYDVESYIISHLVRHNLGFTPFVASLRPDRAEYDTVPDRNTLNNVRFDGNFQSFINISRKRECYQASEGTRRFWKEVMKAVAEFEPELFWACIPECIYRGGCPEMKTCETALFGKFLRWCMDNGGANQIFNIHKRYDLWMKYKEESGE